MLIRILIIGVATAVNARHRLLQYNNETKTESVKLYGNLDGYAYWFADLVVGRPSQRVSVILDTGSSVCAFPCDICESCGTHIDPVFNLSGSSSAVPLGCSSDCPGTCSGSKCTYHVSYFEGSSIQGVWFTDFVQLGDRVESNIPVRSSLGCHTTETKLFYTQQANGIMGVGPRRHNSAPNVLHALFTDNRIDKSLFSICLHSEGGELTVGGYNSSYLTSPVIWVPMSPQSSFYEVAVVDIRIGASNRPPKPTTAMIDSGSTLAYFPKHFHDHVLDVVKLAVLSSFSDAVFTPSNRCFRTENSKDMESVIEVISSSVGAIEIIFASGETVPWPPNKFLYNSGPNLCAAVGDSGADDRIVLGAAWLVSRNVVFDVVNHKFGFADANCPSYSASERPSADQFSTQQPTTSVVMEELKVASVSAESVPFTSTLGNTLPIESKSDQTDSGEDHQPTLVILLSVLACISLGMIFIVIFRRRRRGFILTQTTAVPYEIVVEESEMVTVKSSVPQSP